MNDLVLMGVITGVRGLKGELRVKPFNANPDEFFDYGPLLSEDGKKKFEGRVIGQAKGQLLVRLGGIGDRNAAEALKGTKLYLSREALPETDEDEFYHSDLVGLTAELLDGSVLGTIRWVLEAGAGASLEIETSSGELLVPFTKASVPIVDIQAGKVVIDPPDGLFDTPPPEAQENKSGQD